MMNRKALFWPLAAMLLTACEKGLEDDVLTKLTVTALDQNDNIIKEKVFENVPVSRNQVTRYTGSFFGSGGTDQTSDGTLRLTADPDWDSVNGYTF